MTTVIFDNVCSIIFFFLILPWLFSHGGRP
jgi:hypothetical protein